MDAYLGSITLFAFDWAPLYYSSCNGAILPINQNTALFSLLGTYFGGNGVQTFALPNLSGRVPVGVGAIQGGQTDWTIGQFGGTEYTTLTQNQLPSHTHTAVVNVKSGLADAASPVSHYLAVGHSGQTSVEIYGAAADTDKTLASDAVTVGSTGNSQPIYSYQPSLGIGYAICMQGIFPSRQ